MTRSFRSERISQGAWDEDGKRTKQYIEALLNQTRMWMEGISMHNRITGECCPDFSCCHPDMLTAKPERQTRGQKMLLTFADRG